MGPSSARIRAFNAVAREGSFSKAAVSLDVSQPAVTAQVRRLEGDYGRQLFERAGHGAQLTAFGRRLYRVTQNLDDIEDAIEVLLKGSEDLEGQEFRVATASPQVFMPLLARFQRLHPGISMEITLGSTGEALDRVANRQADVGLTPTLGVDPRFQILPFIEHHLVLVVPDEPRWENRTRISLKELSGEPVIFRTGPSVTQRMVERLFEAYGIRWTPSLRLATREAVHEAVANGLGLGFVLHRDMTPDTRLKTIEIREPMEEVWENVVWLKHRSNVPIIREFVATARAELSYAEAVPH